MEWEAIGKIAMEHFPFIQLSGVDWYGCRGVGRPSRKKNYVEYFLQ